MRDNEKLPIPKHRDFNLLPAAVQPKVNEKKAKPVDVEKPVKKREKVKKHKKEEEPKVKEEIVKDDEMDFWLTTNSAVAAAATEVKVINKSLELVDDVSDKEKKQHKSKKEKKSSKEEKTNKKKSQNDDYEDGAEEEVSSSKNEKIEEKIIIEQQVMITHNELASNKHLKMVYLFSRIFSTETNFCYFLSFMKLNQTL